MAHGWALQDEVGTWPDLAITDRHLRAYKVARKMYGKMLGRSVRIRGDASIRLVDIADVSVMTAQGGKVTAMTVVLNDGRRDEYKMASSEGTDAFVGALEAAVA